MESELFLNGKGEWEINNEISDFQGSLSEMMKYMENNGWEYRWTHANGVIHYFRK